MLVPGEEMRVVVVGWLLLLTVGHSLLISHVCREKEKEKEKK